MEDVEFFRPLHRCGRVQYSNQRVIVSPRRYEAVGRTRLTLAYGVIATLYVLAFHCGRSRGFTDEYAAIERDVIAPNA